MTYYRRAQRWVMLLGLTLICAACSRAQPTPPVLEPAGVLELPYAIESMAWHPNGKWLAVGYFNRDEVEVWDVLAKKSILAVPSRRRLTNLSGQELIFSADGQYLVVEDFTDTKNGEPKFPRNYADPLELPAQQDTDRYVLGRVWDMEQKKEVAQLKGPGSTLYGGNLQGMCFAAGQTYQLILLRGTAVSVYDIQSGKHQFTVHLRYPFADKPGFSWGYERMNCSPSRFEVALRAGILMKKAPEFGYPLNSGATPIVVVDLEKKAVKKVLFSATPLNGVTYTADGSKLVSFGAPPIRVWDANADFADVGEINDPHLNSGLMTPVPGYDGLLGISNALRIWSTEALRNVYTLDTKEYDTFRIALHAPTQMYAVAVTKYAHFYRLNSAQLRSQSQNTK